jgi:hypothetical protein
MDGIWYWMWSGIGNWRGYLRPTLDYWPMIEDLKAEMAPVRQGLGDLILKSEPLHSRIAVFYSLPSALSGQLENSPQFADPQQDHIAWTRLTYDLGLDFKYLTRKMLLGGALTNQEFSVLLLPMTQALAPDEVALIRAFAEGGGTVISDFRPGLYDGHCKPVLPGVLDDLFGITRTGRGTPVEAQVVIQPGANAPRLDLGQVRVDSDVQPAGATVLAQAKVGDREVPVVLSRSVGAGKAILVNCVLPASDPRAATTEAARRLLAWLYHDAGSAAPAAVTSPSGGSLPLTEARFWRTGDGLVLGMWRQMEAEWFTPTRGTAAGEPQPVRVSFAEPMHVYDLRAHRYLGMRKNLRTSLRWGRASFYLALPYPIGKLGVSLADAAPAPGKAVSADLSLRLPAGSPETFAAWVQVFDPAGNEQVWGRQVVMLTGGKGQVQVARAFNDAPGTWRLRATELFSNQSTEATWTVR